MTVSDLKATCFLQKYQKQLLRCYNTKNLIVIEGHVSWTLVLSYLCVCAWVCVCVQMVRTTGGPALGASVSSPAMTNSAITLLQDNLNEEERQLWSSLGPNWTLPRLVPTVTGSAAASFFKYHRCIFLSIEIQCHVIFPDLLGNIYRTFVTEKN